MSTDGTTPKPRDSWSKLDIGGRFFAGVVVAGVALFLKSGAEEVTASLDRGRLVQDLIEDLSSGGQGVRRDIALIALERTVVDASDSAMVAAIAERLLFEYKDSLLVSDSEPGLDTTSVLFSPYFVALDILERYDKDRHDQWVARVLASIVSPLDTADVGESRVSPEVAALRLAVRQPVYIQFTPESARPDVVELRDQLRGRGYNIPGIEAFPGRYANEVRYFHEADRGFAEEIAQEVRDLAALAGMDLEIAVRDFTRSRFDAPAGQIEVWLNRETSSPQGS